MAWKTKGVLCNDIFYVKELSLNSNSNASAGYSEKSTELDPRSTL